MNITTDDARIAVFALELAAREYRKHAAQLREPIAALGELGALEATQATAAGYERLAQQFDRQADDADKARTAIDDAVTAADY